MPVRVGRPQIFCSDFCRRKDRRAHVRLYVLHHRDKHRRRSRLGHPWEFSEDLDADDFENASEEEIVSIGMLNLQPSVT